MKTIIKHRTWFLGTCAAVLLSGLLASIALIAPPSSKAAASTSDMPALMFPPVTVSPAQHLMVCGSDMGEVAVSGVIGLLDVADTTKSLASVPLSLKPNTGSCTRLNIDASGRHTNVIAYVAFPPDTAWNSTSGKAFVASLQVREGGDTKSVIVPTFFPAVPIPQAQ